MAALFARNAAVPQVLPTSGTTAHSFAGGRLGPRLIQGLIGGALVLVGRKKQGHLMGRAASAAGFSLLASSVEGSNLKRLFDRRS